MRGDASKKSATEPHPRHALRGGCAVVDAVSCINPTDADKSGVREINVLQGREGRRDTWARIRRREAVDEWGVLEFAMIFCWVLLNDHHTFLTHTMQEARATTPAVTQGATGLGSPLGGRRRRGGEEVNGVVFLSSSAPERGERWGRGALAGWSA